MSAKSNNNNKNTVNKMNGSMNSFGPTPSEVVAAVSSGDKHDRVSASSTTSEQPQRRQVKAFRPPGQRRQQPSSGGSRDVGHDSRGSNSVPPLPDHVDPPVKAPDLDENAREALVVPAEKFEDFMGQDTNGGDGVNDNLLRGIYSNGFERPSIIQARAIRPVLSGQDVVAQAQSGMGKTGAFCIGTLGRINTAVNTTQAIVLAHTRELATQIESVFRKIGCNTAVRITTCIGGSRQQENVAALTGNGTGQRPHVVIGTPGRMIDMLTRRDRFSSQPVMDTRGIKMLVIDEADAMLGTTTEAARSGRSRDRQSQVPQGFLEEVNRVVEIIPQTAQICLFSATMNSDFFHLVDGFLPNPIKVTVKTDELTLDGIKQFCVDVEKQEYKFETLCALYKLLNINQSIIYCNSKRSVDILTSNLKANGYTVSSIHSGLDAQTRELTMKEFASGKSRVLVSTDLLARGIDVQQVSVVINYDLPEKVESYIHRIGRSGRYGRKGVAINIITDYDISKVDQLEQYYSTQIDPLPEDFETLLD